MSRHKHKRLPVKGPSQRPADAGDVGRIMDEMQIAQEIAQQKGIPLGSVTADMMARHRAGAPLLRETPVLDKRKTHVRVVSGHEDKTAGLKGAELRNELAARINEIIPQALAGVKPFEEIPDYPASKAHDGIRFVLPDAELAKTMRGVANARLCNGVGWGIVRKGKVGFIAPKMQVCAIGHNSFDESEVVEAVKAGGVEAVYMMVSEVPGMTDAAQLYYSQKKIAEETGQEIPTYLVAINPNIGVGLRVSAFRINPRISEEDVGEAIRRRDTVLEEYKRGLNHINDAGYDKFEGTVVGQMVDARARFTSEFVERKTGRQDYARTVKESLDEKRDENIQAMLRERSNMSQLLTNYVAAEQTFFWALFVNPNVLEEVEVVKPMKGVMPFRNAEKMADVMEDLASGLTLDSELKFGSIWALANTASSLGPHARVLKPLAKAIDDGAPLDDTTLMALRLNLDRIGKCARYTPPDDELFDAEVSSTIARVKVREKLWETHEIPGMNTPEEINQSITTLIDTAGDPAEMKDQLNNALRGITGHTLAELQSDDKLMEVHAAPVAEIVHGVIDAGIKHLGQAREDAQKELDAAEGMSLEEARRQLNARNSRVSRKKRVKVDDETVAAHRERTIKSAQNRARSLFEGIDDMKKKLEAAMTVTAGDYTSTMLETIEEGGRQTLEEEAGSWLEKRRPLDGKATHNLFSDPSEKGRQSAFAKCINPVFPLGQPKAVEEGNALIKDLYCFSQTIPKEGGAGTIGGMLAEAGVDITGKDKRGLKASIRLSSAAWGDREISREDLPTLARGQVFAEHVLGREAVESRYLAQVAGEMPDELKESYASIVRAFRSLVWQVPKDMK